MCSSDLHGLGRQGHGDGQRQGGGAAVDEEAHSRAPTESGRDDNAAAAAGADTAPGALATGATLPVAGTVLAFDLGEKRIGVAIGETSLGIAHPLATIPGEQRQARIDAIAALIAEWTPVLLVVGLPLHMDGSEHEMTRRCRNFARSLEGRFRIPARLVDERLTSRIAAGNLHEAGVPGSRHKASIDQVAAQLILQSHFDAAS